MDLRIAHHVSCTEAEGPGRRFALWVAGCTLRCPGCCNPELFDPAGGHAVAVEVMAEQIIEAAAELELEGMTILGGEPLEQLVPVAALLATVGRLAEARSLDLGRIVFTGFTLEEARRRPGFGELWARLDTLIDGRFDAGRPEPEPARGGRRYLGSTNQRIHHRTGRYADPARWAGPRTAELQIRTDGTLSAHGFPSEVVRLRRSLADRR